MDLVIAVICCNCGISIVVLAIALWTIRLRRQVVSLMNFCDRLINDCHLLLQAAPGSLASSRVQVLNLQQIYQRQLVMIDRVRTLQSMIGFARLLLFKRR
jgi:hypothetical protein